MDTKTRLKLAAIACAIDIAPEVQDGKALFAVTKDKAKDIIKLLHKEEIIDSEEITGVKIDALGQTRSVVVSRSFDYDASSPSGSKGDYVNVSADRFFPSGEFEITFCNPESEKPVDVIYDETKGILAIQLWSIKTLPLKKLLGSTDPELCQKGFLVIADKESRDDLLNVFKQMAALKPLSPNDALIPERVIGFSSRAQDTSTALGVALAKANIGDCIPPNQVTAALHAITGSTLSFSTSGP